MSDEDSFGIIITNAGFSQVKILPLHPLPLISYSGIYIIIFIVI